MQSLTWRNVHFWLGTIVAAQLVLWILTGVGFALLPGDELRGLGESRNAPPAALGLEHATAPVAAVAADIEARSGRPTRVERVALERHPSGRLVYLVNTVGDRNPWIYDAHSGDPVPTVTEDEAARIARQDFNGDGAVTTVRLIENESDDRLEYSGPFPVYRVDFSNAKRTRVYVSPFSGRILRRHNIYQDVRGVLWSLHVFEYLDPEVAGNVPLLATSALTLVSIMSGTMLLVPYFRRRLAGTLPAPRRAASLTVQPQQD